MSWEEARERAAEWLAKAGIKRDLRGQVIDLSAIEGLLPADMKAGFKAMVVRAAERMVRKRGGTPVHH